MTVEAKGDRFIYWDEWPLLASGSRVKRQVKRAAQGGELARLGDGLADNGREFGQLVEVGLHA